MYLKINTHMHTHRTLTLTHTLNTHMHSHSHTYLQRTHTNNSFVVAVLLFSRVLRLLLILHSVGFGGPVKATRYSHTHHTIRIQ